jgi:HlyD family secretion protein
MKHIKKNLILASTIIVIICIVIYFFSGSKETSKMNFDSTKVTRGNVSTSVTATGTLEAITSVDVGTQVSGLIKKLYVDYNSVVKKGQLLAELDRTNLQNSLFSALSTLKSNRSDYEYQLKNYKRIKLLHSKQLVSDADLDVAYDSYAKAKGTYEGSKADYEKAKTNLGYAMIYSPIDGIILSKEVEEGQTVAASTSTPTLFKIARDLKKMQVVANVDEADIGGVMKDQRVSFTVDAYPDETFSGTVTQVRQNATTTNNVVTYEVVINAPNENLKLKPGLTASVTIYTQEKINPLIVSSKALRFTPDADIIGKNYQVVNAKNMKTDETHKILWKREGNKFIAIPVVIGISDGTNTEIVSGINEGTQVVLDAESAQTTSQVSSDSSSNASQSSSTSTTSESSPFAPTPPGKSKKK